MASSRIVARSSRALFSLQRTQCCAFSVSSLRNGEFDALNKRTNDTSETYRKYQIEKPLNPHLPNTTSTITNKMPSAGSATTPPELMTNSELGVGEMEGAKFKVEPIKRTGEDANTMRARSESEEGNPRK